MPLATCRQPGYLANGMHIAFALPGPAETGSSGGSHYIHGLVPALRALGHQVDVLEGAAPHLPPGALPVIDGMLLPRLQARADALAEAGAVALIHHVAAAAGRDESARAGTLTLERATLPRMRRVIATSQPVAAQIKEVFGIDAQAVPPGARDLPRNPAAAASPAILAVGVLTRRKGHDVLLRALARLTDLDWTLTIAGDSGREPAHAAELAALIEELGLGRRAALHADPDPATLERDWARAGLFALATRWEGYAAGVAEALRRGIPVVVTEGGDAGALVPADAGAVVSREDPATLGKVLRRMLFDHALRTDMAEAAWQAGQALPSWAQQAATFAQALEH